MNGLQLPNWIVPVAGLAAVVWAVAMWWMVASLPASGTSGSELDLIVARAEIDHLEVTVDELSQQIAELYQERSDLSLRLDTLERPPSALAAEMTQPISPVAGQPPAEPTPGESSQDGEADATVASEDATSDDGQAAGATPTAEPTVAPTAAPTMAPTAEPAPVLEDSATPPPSTQYVTDGRDRYSCSDFDSWEEAQAACEANLPGDPNKIDIDQDGIACEALR